MALSEETVQGKTTFENDKRSYSSVIRRLFIVWVFRKGFIEGEVKE